MQQALREHWPQLPAASEIVEEDGTLSFQLGQAQIAMGIMPVPMPIDDLDAMCQQAILWPNARPALQAHQVHTIISVSGELSPLEIATCLTQVSAALLLASPDALGVYWHNASQLVLKELFCDFAREILPLGPPLTIWVDTRTGWLDENHSHSAGYTRGLRALGLMEMETLSASETPADLRDRFESIAGYLLENGPVIQDGDTLGESAQERIRVQYADSAFGLEQQVMRLMYEALH